MRVSLEVLVFIHVQVQMIGEPHGVVIAAIILPVMNVAARDDRQFPTEGPAQHILGQDGGGIALRHDPAL